MLDFEVYEGRTEKNRKKTYLVADADNLFDLYDIAKRFFRCSKDHVLVAHGWVLNDELYLSNPRMKGAKKKAIAYYV